MAPKKAALRIFLRSKENMTPSEAIELVRQAALSYFPREDIAKLTGHEWYAFLDKNAPSPIFIHNETLWQNALYHKEPNFDSARLVNDCQEWIQNALPPVKRS